MNGSTADGRYFRVEQTTETLLNLQREVMKGHAAPAAFQRPYVWQEAHVVALWESMMMGIPIGSFLLWQPKEQARTSRMLGPVTLDTSNRAALILDGQNRLATLAWSATDPGQDVPAEAAGLALWRSGRRLVADVDAKRIRFADASETDRWLIPMHVVGHSMQMHIRKTFGQEDIEDWRFEWLDDVERALREARVVVTRIYSDEETARAAYLRICSAGVPISPEDFDAAVKGSVDA